MSKIETPLLEVNNMSISFQMYEKGWTQTQHQSVSDLSISVNKGEILAVVGSSGSGKSLLAHGILGLLPENATMSGEIYHKGTKMDEKAIKDVRGKSIALIPQSISYLDPLMKIGQQVQGADRSKESKKRQRQSFEKYDLCEKSEKLYPFQLSGGMARRALISTAAQRDDVDLIIADEPTPGLDIEMAMKTLKYFREFANQGKGVLMITHDIDLALHIADQIAVFYGGTVLEIARVSDFHKGVEALRHPYTKALFEALPQNGFKSIKGTQPYGKDIPKGCIYSPRCENAKEACHHQVPMRKVREGMVRCHHAT